MKRFLALSGLVVLLGSCFDDDVTIVNSGSSGAVEVTITAVDATASEAGDPGTFAVSRSGDASQPLTVNLTVGGTATEGVDYGTIGTTLTIPAGVPIAFLAVTPIDDPTIEPNETVLVTLAPGTGYTVGAPASATVTIVDDDAPTPTVTISAVDPGASESGDTGTFAVIRAGNASAALTVNITVAGTATSGTDYVALGPSVVIPAGASIAFLTVTPIADGAIEPNETVQVTLAAGTGYTVGSPSTATVTIVDGNATTPTVSIAALDADASESGDGGTFAVLRAGDASAPLTVNVTLTGTATNGTDYTAIPTTVSLPAGAFIAIVAVAPLADRLVEGPETVILTAVAGTGYVVGSPASATVTIADVPPTYSTPEVPAGLSAVDNFVWAADLGSDGEPRMVYHAGDNGGTVNGQIRFVRRRPNGTWTTPVAVCVPAKDIWSSVFVAVSRSNNFTHIFWIQRPGSAFTPTLHYSQINNADPPVATVPDIIISTGPATNLGVGATFGNVESYSAAIDRSNDNIAVVWSQAVVDGASGVAAIAGLITAGSGFIGEKFALAVPADALFAPLLPLVRIGPGGAVHALFGGAIHRLRTGVNTWSATDTLSNTFNTRFKDLVIAPDGDAYAVIGGVPVQAAYRPVGAGTTFGPLQGTPLSTNGLTTPKITAVLEPGTEILHVFVAEGGPSAPGGPPTTAIHTAANLSGAWALVPSLHPFASAGSDAPGEYVAFVDGSNTVTVVFRAPIEAGPQSNILARSHTTGAGTTYAPVVDLSANFAFPMFEVAMAQNASRNTFVAWRQGGLVPGTSGTNVTPEIFARRVSAGTWSSPADNVSQSPAMPSHGAIVLLLSDSGIEHVFWNESNGAAAGTSDVFYSRR